MLTQDDLKLIKQAVVDTTAPMFEMVFGRFDGLEGRMDKLEGRMNGLEGRMDGLEKEFQSFKIYVEGRFVDIEQRLRELNQKIDDQTATFQERIENISEDIDLLAKLSTKLEKGTAAEREFAQLTLDHQVPILFRQLQTIAKKAGIKLPA